ncbi:MAG TPA: sigma-70 family RNA polymerase sigma factor [Thermoanaerobaculia bacterium]|nr:sigma-70 family RNA polymerase sigma factor [Thermoanaerobaculia bacterium]
MSGPRGEVGTGLLAVLEESRPALVRLFSKRGVPLADAEDILQETMVVMVERWERIKEPERYLFGTVRRLISLLIRRRQRARCVRLEGAELGAAGVVGSPARAVESREDARRLLARLPRRAGRIVEMRYGQELTIWEIGAALGLAPSGVRKIAGRQLERLRRAAKVTGSSE